MNDSLRAHAIKSADLTEALIDQMYCVYSRYYDSADFGIFTGDLKAKDFVVLLHSRDDDKLRGFSTVGVYDLTFQARPFRVIYSGDTIIERDFWGERTLPFEWCRLAGKLKAERPDVPLYWLLIVKGHRTYRLMTLFAKTHYPSWKWETPLEFAELMDHLGRSQFGSHYDSTTGVIRWPHSRGHLKPEYGLVRERYSEKPDVRFFLDRNPGYLKGEELLCLAELTPDNMRSVARRGFSEAFL